MIRDLANVPNAVSLVRIGLIPIFVWLVIVDEYTWAGILFGFIGATDWIDGYLARRLDQVTEIGKILDPVADRAAVVIAVIGGIVVGVLPAWFGWGLIVREAAIGVGALWGWRHGVDRLDVRWLGKTATFGVYVAVALFYIGEGAYLDVVIVAANLIGLPSLVMYYWVGVEYLGDMRRAAAGQK